MVCLRQRQRPASLIFLLTGIPIHDTVAVVRPRLRLQHLGQPFSFGVGVVPEVEEKEQENQAVQADDVDEDGELVGAVRNEEILGDVAGHHNKLYQLDGGEVLLPPQVLLVVGAHGSQTVVRVHDDMDHTVEKGMECSHTTSCKPNSEPPGERHDGVMVHMQKRHLAVLFPEHEEDRVQHLNEL